MQTESNRILSDIIVHTKYARYLSPLKRRETWDEIVDRNVEMHSLVHPEYAKEIGSVFNDYVRNKKVLPSMRSAQFAGIPILRNPSRIYNCGYMPAQRGSFFNELMFLLLGGTGVGYSVQRRHIGQLPRVQGPRLEGRARRYVVGDSSEGWSDAVKVLVESFFYGKRRVRFDFADIRDKGKLLVTSGGKAPGPDPLRKCLIDLGTILHGAIGRRLTPLEAHDMACYIADAVLAGGIRRAAMIVLFDRDDMEMMTCKSPEAVELNPQRQRANNSIILLRGSITKRDFKEIWKRIEATGTGEPGIYWTYDLDWGTNPCCEIALRAYQFCNLTTVNVSDVSGQHDLNDRARAAAFIGTLQATYTDFHYLNDDWSSATIEESLIGVSLTGIASGAIKNLDMNLAAWEVVMCNKEWAQKLGIPSAARTTTVKPEGTGSLVLGCSSGVHAWHNNFFYRRMRLLNNEAIVSYLQEFHPELIEEDYFNPTTQSILTLPQMAPEGSTLRTEPVLDLLGRVMALNTSWVEEGHSRGVNMNNVSCTISVRDDEWGKVGEYLWEHRNSYNGVAVFPYHDAGHYKQAPLEDITRNQYMRAEKSLKAIDLSKVVELEDNTTLTMEAACAGGVCEIV